MIIYIVGFSIEGNSGKSKATREKSKALKNKFGSSNFYIIYPRATNSKLKKILNRLTFDIFTFSKIIFIKNIDFVIQRVIFMPATRLLLYIKGAKVISEFHADFKEEIPLLNKSKIEKKLLYLFSFFFYLNYKLSDGIIYNHPYLKEKFDQVFKKPSIFSYNGANVKDFKIKSMLKSRKLLGLPDNEIIFLFIGSISKWHGVDYLVDVFNTTTLTQKENIKLYIVGGYDNNYIRLLKQKSVNNMNIIFIPKVDNNMAVSYINSANYCLLPVKENRTSPGSPLKLYDYISCGKPVISQSNVMGYSDEIENYGLGYTVDFTQPNDAAKKILTFMSQSNENYFLVNNRKVAATKVSWSKRIEKWQSFFLTI